MVLFILLIIPFVCNVLGQTKKSNISTTTAGPPPNSINQNLGKLQNFLSTNPFSMDKLQSVSPTFDQINRAQCEKLLRKKPDSEPLTTTTTEGSDLPAGLLGGIQLLTNPLGSFAKIGPITPSIFFCTIRAPLNVVIGLLEELLLKVKDINGPKYKKNIPRPGRNGSSPSFNRDQCDCNSFGDDVPLATQVVRVLETVVVTLRQVISLVNILLVTPAGGMCKGNLDDFGSVVGRSIGGYLPLNVVG